MTNRQKILIGGLGGITPVFMNLLVIDLEVLLQNFTMLALLGYIIRVIVLFYLGGIVAYLNKGVDDPIKVFQLGIVAPALITAFINGSNIEVKELHPSNALERHTDASWPGLSIIPLAYAQPEEEGPPLPHKEEGRLEQFLRGLLGRPFRPINEDPADTAWEAYNNGDYDRAIERSSRCIDEYERTAIRMQKELEEQGIALSSETVDEGGREERSRYKPLNDTATCWFIKARSLEKINRKEEAISAYCNAMRYTHARAYDPRLDLFWAPAMKAKERLSSLGGNCD